MRSAVVIKNIKFYYFNVNTKKNMGQGRVFREQKKKLTTEFSYRCLPTLRLIYNSSHSGTSLIFFSQWRNIPY